MDISSGRVAPKVHGLLWVLPVPPTVKYWMLSYEWHILEYGYCAVLLFKCNLVYPLHTSAGSQLGAIMHPLKSSDVDMHIYISKKAKHPTDTRQAEQNQVKFEVFIFFYFSCLSMSDFQCITTQITCTRIQHATES